MMKKNVRMLKLWKPKKVAMTFMCVQVKQQHRAMNQFVLLMNEIKTGSAYNMVTDSKKIEQKHWNTSN